MSDKYRYISQEIQEELNRYTAVQQQPTDENNPGRSYTIYVFQDDQKIGEYVRVAESLGNSFHPFRQGDKYYALYSRHLTGISVMTLPECKEIASLKDDTMFSFCPVEFMVPIHQTFEWDDTTGFSEPYPPGTIWRRMPDEKNGPNNVESRDIVIIPEYAFALGYHWAVAGEDGALIYLDLKGIESGKLELDYRFGNINFNGRLKDIEFIPFGTKFDRFTVPTTICLETDGKVID